MKMQGAWVKQYLEFFDTEEVRFIKSMADADALISMWFELISLAGKLGTNGSFLFKGEIPYTDEMFASYLRRPLPAVRQALKTFTDFGMFSFTDGVYAVADWEKTQNADALNAMREGNRIRKARERAKKNPTGISSREKKRELVRSYLAEHPTASDVEVSEKTGVSRPTVAKYRRELAPRELPCAPEGEAVKTEGVKIDTVKNAGVKVDNFDTNFDSKIVSKVDTNFDTDFDTLAAQKAAGERPDKDKKGTVKNVSRPKKIDEDEEEELSSTSTAGGGRKNVRKKRPTRDEVRTFFVTRSLTVSPDRFFDYNEERGWRTTTGRAIDDWQRLALTWESHERPSGGVGNAPSVETKNAPTSIPSPEEVMARFSCTREEAERLIREDMY